jgi:hypothetical protein
VSCTRSRKPGRSLRVGLAAVLTAGALVALAATGGLSYAASSVTRAADSVVHVVAPAQHAKPTGGLGSAQAQYLVTLCFHGHTIRVDNHAENVLLRNGATKGACGAGSFTPPAKSVVMCFRGNNVYVSPNDVAKLKKLGFRPGFCKKK